METFKGLLTSALAIAFVLAALVAVVAIIITTWQVLLGALGAVVLLVGAIWGLSYLIED